MNLFCKIRFVIPVACTLMLAMIGYGTAQETIKPQFMFGGNLNLTRQDKAIEGEVVPFQETPQIRPLPPNPVGTSSFGFPQNSSMERGFAPSGPESGTVLQSPVMQSPVMRSPNVPDLGHPGSQLPFQNLPENGDFQNRGGFQAQPVPQFIEQQWQSPQGGFTEFVDPQAISRRPVVIPNEPELNFSQAREPEFQSSLNSGPQDLDAPNPFQSSALIGEESTVINEGFRRTVPTVRGGPLEDYGQEFDFENKKKEYPPFSEIMKTGRYFGNAELLYLKPYFQNNTAITVEGTNTGFSETFDFGYDTGNRFLLGFESKYGPGAELNYFQYDHQSRESDFTSSGGFQGESATWMAGPGRWSRLRTANDGDRLTASHSLEVQNLGVSFFKDWKLPIAKLGGGFGIQYVSIEQDLQARLFDNTGTQIGALSARHELRAFGPKFEFKYYRPVGHTKLDIIGGFSGAVLFGNRDQSVVNTQTLDTSRVGADEFLMVFDVIAGLQYSHQYADNRNFYARISLMSQAWMGGGTAMTPQDDLGFRGVGFGVGFNR